MRLFSFLILVSSQYVSCIKPQAIAAPLDGDGVVKPAEPALLVKSPSPEQVAICDMAYATLQVSNDGKRKITLSLNTVLYMTTLIYENAYAVFFMHLLIFYILFWYIVLFIIPIISVPGGILQLNKCGEMGDTLGAKAYRDLANLYLEGSVIQRDYMKVYEYYTLGSNLGDPGVLLHSVSADIMIVVSYRKCNIMLISTY